MLAVNQLVGIAALPKSLRLVSRIEGDYTADEFDIPSGVKAGDLLVTLASIYATSTPSSSLSGFTTIATASVQIFTDYYRVAAWYRLCDGTEGAAVPCANNLLAGMTYCIRAPRPIIGVQASIGSDWNAEVTGGNPSPQTISAADQPAPLLAFALGASDSAAGFSTETPSFAIQDAAFGQGNYGTAGLTIYNSAPSDHTVNMSGSGYFDGLVSGFIKPLF